MCIFVGVFILQNITTADADKTSLSTILEKSSEESNENNNGNGQKQKGIISDIEKLKKIGEILQTVGEKVIPVIINSKATVSAVSAAKKDISSSSSSVITSKTPLNKTVQLIHKLKKEADDLAKNIK